MRVLRPHVLCVLLAILFPAIAIHAELQVECGFGGFTHGAWFTVRATGCPPGTRVEVTTIEKTPYAKVKEKILSRTLGVFPAEPGRPAIIFCRQAQGILRVRAVLPDGRTEQNETKVKVLQANDTLVLTVSDTPNAFDLLGSIHLPNRGMTCVVPCDRDRFPTDRRELQGVTIVLLDGATSSLSPDQRSALQQWVTSGGTVVLTARALLADATGTERDGLLPAVTIASPDPKVGPSPTLATLMGNLQHQVKGVPVYAFDVPPRMRVLEDPVGTLVIGEDVGMGRVLALGFDWQNIDVADRVYAGSVRQRLWSKLLVICGRPGIGGLPNNVVTPDEAKARFLLGYIAAFLVAYVIILGPLNWLVLRSLRKLEWSVVTVPAGAVFFSFVAFAIGLVLRSDKVIQREFSVVVLGNGYGFVQGSVGILSPDRKDYTMTLTSGTGLFWAQDRNYLNPSLRNNQDMETRISGDKSLLSNVKIGMWSMRYFGTDDVIPMRGEVQTSLSCNRDSLTGSITNNLPFVLRDAWILARGNRLRLGDIAAGASTNFTLKVALPSCTTPTWCRNCGGYHGGGLSWEDEDTSSDGVLPKDSHAQVNAVRAGFRLFFDRPVLVARQDVTEPLVTFDRPEVTRQSRQMIVITMPIQFEGPDLNVPVGLVPQNAPDSASPDFYAASSVRDIRPRPWSRPFRSEGTRTGRSVSLGDVLPDGVELNSEDAIYGPTTGYQISGSYRDFRMPFKGGNIETLKLTLYFDANKPDPDEKQVESMIIAYDWKATNWVELTRVKEGKHVFEVPDPGRFLHESSTVVRLEVVPVRKPAEGEYFRNVNYLDMAYEGRRKVAQHPAGQ